MPKQDNKQKGGLKIHPLFLLVGIYYTVTGELFIFLLSTLVALQHELAHALAAAKLGYKLNKITLMPFGALIDGDLDGLTGKDEIFVATAGPFCNLCTAALFLALWWLYPSTYPFTDTAFYASLAIFAVNLIPAYPLDGGRVLKSMLILRFQKSSFPEHSKIKASKICKIITLMFSIFGVGIFLLFCLQGKINVSILFFSIFLAVSCFGKDKQEHCYIKMQFCNVNALSRGMLIKRVAILQSAPLKKAVSFVGEGEYLILSVYDEQENFLGELTQNQLNDAFAQNNIYTPIGSVLLKN